ncbi:Ketosamine-3-kinase [Rhizophagus irregularis]|uniref:protein-ribulosamine 3-kinase n=1 Tax=Rhizophagus irregularis TaxID=588596 RepID=A0A2I1H4H9_9GLOM|nr:Ketosamine-3-kinase [Rhizophagus irregularis]
MSQIAQIILETLQNNGICTKVLNKTALSGGCLNDAFKLSTDTGNVFVKTNSGSNSRLMFEGESESLNAIHEAVPGFAPKPLCFGTLPNEGAFIVTTYIRLSTSNSASIQILFARKLAEMHSSQSPNGKFGFPVMTMCGITEQDNTWEVDWPTFYKERRLRPILEKCLQNNPGDSELRRLGEIVIDKVVDHIMKDIEIKPVLIHGDLWSGNWGVNLDANEPVIYDPSSCYGHNEYELGILTMFGSPGSEFFREYHKYHPRQEPYFEQRQELYQLYHYLNHYYLFGGGYQRSAISIMRRLCDLV